MAARDNKNRRRSERSGNYGGMYIYGNTVSNAEVAPRRRHEESTRPVRKQNVKRQTKHHKRADQVNGAYVVFVVMVCMITLGVCAWYLNARMELTHRSEKIVELQRELSEIKEENDTRENEAMNSVNLNEIKKTAGEHGMKEASEGQVIFYQNPLNVYAKQYEAIPKSGVLPQSDKVNE